MSGDDELAHELLLGVPGEKGRTYLKPGSERELEARRALARLIKSEAPDGYYTQRLAQLIDPPPLSTVIKQRIVFRRPKGTPAVSSDRLRAEIAAYMRRQLEGQKRKGAGTDAQKRNLKPVIAATIKKFGIGRSTIMNIWSEFRPRKSPNK